MKNYWSWLLISLIIIGFSSCHFIIPTYRSQLGYQSYEYWQLDTFQLVKFNPKELSKLVRTYNRKKFIIFLHNNHCGVTQHFNRHILDSTKGLDNVILIPVVHDYFYNFSKSIKNRYGKEQPIYYTDAKIYGRTINPIKSWYENVLPKFYPNYLQDSINRNFYFIDSISGSKIFFYNDLNSSIKSVLDSSILIQYALP